MKKMPKTTYENKLYCDICKKYLTDKPEDDLIETGAPISGSVPVCPHCNKATFGDGLDYKKENPITYWTKEEILQAIKNMPPLLYTKESWSEAFLRQLEELGGE